MSVLPPGQQYIGHCGKRARLRYLRQRYNRIDKLAKRDDATEHALLRCHAAVDMEPDPDYAAMHLTSAALDAAEGTGATWAEAMNSLLDRFAVNAVMGGMPDVGHEGSHEEDREPEGRRTG